MGISSRHPHHGNSFSLRFNSHGEKERKRWHCCELSLFLFGVHEIDFEAAEILLICVVVLKSGTGTSEIGTDPFAERLHNTEEGDPWLGWV